MTVAHKVDRTVGISQWATRSSASTDPIQAIRYTGANTTNFTASASAKRKRKRWRQRRSITARDEKSSTVLKKIARYPRHTSDAVHGDGRVGFSAHLTVSEGDQIAKAVKASVILMCDSSLRCAICRTSLEEGTSPCRSTDVNTNWHRSSLAFLTCPPVNSVPPHEINKTDDAIWSGLSRRHQH